MRGAERYLYHLHHIISASDSPASFSEAPGETLRDFFDEIVGDRVRIARTDWQGHALPALLLNLPNLKPSAKTALIEHVTDRWHVYVSDSTMNGTATEAVGQSPAMPAMPDRDHTESVTDTHPADISGDQAVECTFVTGNACIRRDWFDRLTDWVAAVVSLWK